jgi:hypothetical protein
LAKAMFTMRKVFSYTFTSSAASALSTGTMLSNTCAYSAIPASVHAGVMPPSTLGVLRVCHCGLPGSTRSGLKQRKKSSPTCSPDS